MQSAECDSGELYVDGQLSALFQTGPAFFSQHYPKRSFVLARAETVLLSYPSGWPENRQGLKLRDDASSVEFFFEMLNYGSFSPFMRPRKRVRNLPDNFVVIGTNLLNRECYIGAGSDRFKYNDDDARLGSVSNLLGAALFGKPNLRQAFVPGAAVELYLVLSDKSASLTIKFGQDAYEAKAPVRLAADVGPGDPCLYGAEHMRNTYRMANGTTQYRRMDDAVLCTYSISQMSAMKNAIEGARDVRYFQLWSSEPCSSVLGIPIYRQYYVIRDGAGAGSSVWTKCLGTETFVEYAPTSMITFQ